MSCDWRTSLGAYVLGALEPADRAGIQSHLSDCRDCREELVELAPLAGLLRHTPFEEFPGAGPPLRRALAGAAPAAAEPAPRRRRLFVAAGVAAAALAVAVSAFFIRPFGGSTEAEPSAEIRLSAADPDTHVRARAALSPKAWGTAMRLTLTGLPQGVRCRLLVHTADGRTETGGTWASGYASGATVPASTSASPQDITRIDIVADDSSRLVRLERR